MSGRDFFSRRRSSPSTVVVVVGRCLRRSSPSSVVRHFPFSSKGGTFEKNQIFSVFQKTLNFSQIRDFRQNEWTRFFRRRGSSPSTVVVVVGRRLRRSSPSSVVRHFSFSSKGGTFEKNQIFAVFQKLAIFLKFEIFGKMSGQEDFVAVAGRRCRRSSSSSVVAVVGRRRRPSSVISLFRPREGPLKKIKFSLFFKKLCNFSKIQDFRQNEWTRFFSRRGSSPSTVVVVVGRCLRRSSPSSVVRHFPFSSKGGTFEKNQNQIFSVFGKMSGEDDGRPTTATTDKNSQFFSNSRFSAK